MMKTLALAVAAAVLAGGPARADVWDQAGNNDDSPVTGNNPLAHGVDQTHDLGAHGTPVAGDEDWFLVSSVAQSSYEVIVDNVTGDLGLIGGDVSRRALDGTTVLQTSVTSDGGLVRLRWESGSTTELNRVRVNGASCGTGCTTDDRYRIRFYETTYTLPRFNNSATQGTIVAIASTTSADCAFTLHYYAESGVGILLGSTASIPLVGRSLKVISTAADPIAAGKSGWIVVTHTCGYGGLTGKAVAVEPATGFSFDTPLVPKVL